uniref:Uncharacterized protein n=1 Tax=Strigamia maritima TaxID=126957 RepID=T1J930_STRMM
MGKDNELLYLIKSEDIQSLSRLLCKVRNSKPKLLGSKRVNVNVQDSDGLKELFLLKYLEIGCVRWKKQVNHILQK